MKIGRVHGSKELRAILIIIMRVIRSVKEASEFLAQSFLKAQGRAVVLTGAGISTPQVYRITEVLVEPTPFRKIISQLRTRTSFRVSKLGVGTGPDRFLGFRVLHVPNPIQHIIVWLSWRNRVGYRVW